jgi:SsrA-binding protein
MNSGANEKEPMDKARRPPGVRAPRDGTMAAKAKSPDSAGEKLVCQNRKATHDYFIEDRLEAGLVLTGTEVKSLRQGKGSLAEAFVQVKNGEAWIIQFHIPHYEQGNIQNVDPVRARKLLLHRKQIDQLAAHVERKGYALVPLKVYFRDSRAKVQIGLARGKKAFDKRESLKQRDHAREMDRARRAR